MRIPRHISLVLAVLLFLASGLGLYVAHQKVNGGPDAVAAAGVAPFRMSDRISTLRAEKRGDAWVFRFQGEKGDRELSAADFAEEVARHHQQTQSSGWWFRVLDITSFNGMLWVLLGFAGQFMFTGRMMVQWIASERAKKSVVPPAFWWMSLFGSSLLILYFWWRVDVVGILGQATGWVVYIRNLWLLQNKE